MQGGHLSDTLEHEWYHKVGPILRRLGWPSVPPHQPTSGCDWPSEAGDRVASCQRQFPTGAGQFSRQGRYISELSACW